MQTGQIIAKHRTQARLSQSELADKVSEKTGNNVLAPNIAAYETGQRIPKIEIREKFAEIFEADPVEFSCVDLSEIDEKRLLCRLLAKYANSMELDNDGKVKVELPTDFTDFEFEYEEYLHNMNAKQDEYEPNTIEYKTSEIIATEKFNYWIRNYPKYDAASMAMQLFSQGCSVDNIKSTRIIKQQEMKPEFDVFKRKYLIPKMTKKMK